MGHCEINGHTIKPEAARIGMARVCGQLTEKAAERAAQAEEEPVDQSTDSE